MVSGDGMRRRGVGDVGDFWECSNKAIDTYNSDMLDAMKSNMDNLLIFVCHKFPPDCGFTDISTRQLSSQQQTPAFLPFLYPR